MPAVILRTQATGVVSRPAYIKHFTVRETVKDKWGRGKTVKTRMQQQVPECQAVIFKCPADKCGKMNSQSILNAKVIDGEILGFYCCKCGRELEVEKPNDKPAAIIVPGIEQVKPFGLVDPFGHPLSR
jgi:uncharacterized protein (DUF983 family)